MKDCYSEALKLLVRRDYSEYGLSQKLLEKGLGEDEIDQAIGELRDQGYLREDLYRSARIRAFLNKLYHPHWIMRKLAAENVQCTDAQIQEEMEDLDFSEEKMLKRLVAKKALTYSEINPKILKKLASFLQSKGYPSSVIFNHLKSWQGSRAFNNMLD